MSARRHIERANHHYKAFEHLRDDYPDWGCVALFYSALHWVSATLADDRDVPQQYRKPTAHNAEDGQGRNQIVNQYYPDIADEYRLLEQMSRIARYHTRQDELDRLQGLVGTLPTYFEKVKTFCEQRRSAF